MSKKARIASYLSQGLKPSQVAAIVGVTPAYISQLLSSAKAEPEGEFAVLLASSNEKADKEVDEDKALTTKYLAVEHKLLQQMEDTLGFAELPAVTAALRVVAERQEKRLSRLQAPSTSGGAVQNIIQITIPSHAIPEHVLNGQKEVVKIGSQNLSPLS